MKLATRTQEHENVFGLENAIKMIKSAGFDCVDISMQEIAKIETSHFYSDKDRLEKAKAIKALSKDVGIEICQAHAPFPTYKADNPEYTKMQFGGVLKSIEVCGEIGIPYLVVHPVHIPGVSKQEQLQFNLDYYGKMLPTLCKTGTKICIENMWTCDKDGKIIPNVCSDAEEMCVYADALGDEHFAVCLDIGHTTLVGEDPAKSILTLGHERLKVVHIHDNHFNNADEHIAPFSGKIDWEAVTEAFAKIDYSGVFTFEAYNHYKNLPKELYESATKYLHDIGRYLINRIEAKK